MGIEEAARLHDGTAHGGQLAKASTNVLVNALGAARLGDPHTCPMIVPYTHVGGTVRFGSGAALTVLINNRPAASHLGALECPTARGLLAANVIEGCSPDVVYSVTNTLGGLPVVEQADGSIRIGKNIVIKGDGEYNALVLADLAETASTPSGQRMLDQRERSGHTVTIVPLKGDRNAYAGPVDGKAAGDGRGTDTVVHYEPRMWPPSDGAKPITTDATRDVVLFHEMTHANHQASGTQDMTKRSDDYHTNEEFNTIEPDENNYRRERGLKKERHAHTHM